MPSLNFQKRFADAVESGKKTQTIRRERKTPIKVGDTLHLFTGMRKEGCRKLGEVVCTSVSSVQIGCSHNEMGRRLAAWMNVDGIPEIMLDTAAKVDGFDDFECMARWFDERYGLPFEGVLIRWSMEGDE